ncbi:MAG: hypothetical protein J7L96_07705, partial [Bacteroidales bacterium]|nr:hypothetical protein [Bacteroidales bacterium]
HFTYLLLLAVFTLHGQAQRENSVLSMSWHDMQSSSALINKSAFFDLQIGQPMAVSNILLTRIKGDLLHRDTRLSFSYSLMNIPGLQEHSIRFGVGKWLKTWLFIQAGFEADITASGKRFQPVYSWSAWNIMFVKLQQEQFFRIELDGWTSLISDQMAKPDPFILFSYLYTFEEDSWLDIGLLAEAGFPLRGFFGVGLKLNDQHSLYSGLMLNPTGFGIGYAFHNQGFTLRILLEGSSVFGLCPISSFCWVR